MKSSMHSSHKFRAWSSNSYFSLQTAHFLCANQNFSIFKINFLFQDIWNIQYLPLREISVRKNSLNNVSDKLITVYAYERLVVIGFQF